MHKVTFLVLLLSALSNLVNCQPTPNENQQYFRIRPQSSVEVIEGNTIVLFCEVGYQAGQVQWSKNSFLLGYDRSIPGYPRYSMVGNAREGVHNLRIENARIEDDGEYQCQVGPGPASQPNDPIRANSKLTVLLRPTINIVGHSNGSKVEIRREENLKLECVVSGGKPAASIKWYRKSYELPSDLNHGEWLNTEVTVSNGPDVYTNPTDIVVTRSHITLKPVEEDNGVEYSCVATHPTLDVPLKNSVFLSVLYPPEPPVLSGYVENETVWAGDALVITCTSHGGNPLADLTWYKDNEQLNFTFTSHSDSKAINRLVLEAQATDNGVYHCEASNAISTVPVKSIPIRIIVRCKPTSTEKVTPVSVTTATSEMSTSSLAPTTAISSEKDRIFSLALQDTEIPRIIIVSVTAMATCLLLMNIFLVLCLVRSIKRRRQDEANGTSSSEPDVSKDGNLQQIQMISSSESGGSASYDPGEEEPIKFGTHLLELYI